MDIKKCISPFKKKTNACLSLSKEINNTKLHLFLQLLHIYLFSYNQ